MGQGDRRIFITLLLSFLFMTVVTASISSFLYLASVDMIEREITNRNTSILNITKKAVDDILSDVKILTTKLAADPVIADFINLKEESGLVNNVFKIFMVHNDMRYRDHHERYVKNIWILQNDLDLIITPYDVLYDISKTYNSGDSMNISFSGLNYQEWRRLLLSNTHFGELYSVLTVQEKGDKFMSLLYMHTLPTGSDSTKGCIIVMMDYREIFSHLKELKLEESGWFTLTDASGQVLTQINREDRLISTAKMLPGEEISIRTEHVEGVEYTVTTVYSLTHDLYYSVGISNRELLKPVYFIRNLALILLSLVFLAGIALSLFFSRRYGGPLVETLSLLKSSSTTAEQEFYRHPFLNLRNNVFDVLEKKHKLEISMKEKEHILRSSLFRMLIYGEIQSFLELETYLKHMPVDFNGKHFRVILVRPYDKSVRISISTGKTPANGMDDFISLLEQEEGFYPVPLSPVLTAFLLIRKLDDLEISSILERVNHYLHDLTGFSFRFTLGNIHYDPLHIHNSFIEAREALDFNQDQNNETVIFYRKISGNGDVYYFPLEEERRLVSLIRKGDLDGLDDLLKNLFQINFSERNLSAVTQHEFLAELRSTGIKLAGQISYLEKPSVFDTDLTIKEQSLSLKEYFSNCIDIIRENQKSSYPVVESVIGYLLKNYSDPNISLTSVAQRFKISEGYLSRLFKEYSGSNFNMYVFRLRMDQACRILSDTNTSVADAGIRCGYASARVFRRAFIRYTGIRPSEYRQYNIS
jgi:two-component system response regulator YesN